MKKEREKRKKKTTTLVVLGCHIKYINQIGPKEQNG